MTLWSFLIWYSGAIQKCQFRNWLCQYLISGTQENNCTAAGIKDALCEFLKDKGIVQGDDYSRIVGLGTDGAAVMTGRHNGLGVKLKQLNNILIQVQCVAHRLNLAASQASKDIDYLEQYKERLSSIYKFYSNSSKRYDKLKEIQQLMHGKVKQVVEPSSVRWLSVAACVKMIIEYYDSLVMSLENEKDSNATAVWIWQFTASALFLLTSALLTDVLFCFRRTLQTCLSLDTVSIRELLRQLKEWLMDLPW